MTQEIKTISREAGGTSKGYTLQKLRSISLILKEIEKNKDLDFIAAIEYGGDVYIGNNHYSYVEENKAYDSKNFSFVSDPIKNTLVYFLDYWLKNNKDSKIIFGIFCTNNIAKENNSGFIKEKGIDLPENKIIESLQAKNYSDDKTIEAAKQILLHEYKRQYEENKRFPLESSFYKIIEEFSTEEWKTFFNKIDWVFSDTSLDKLEKQVLEQIIKSNFAPPENLEFKAPFIRAELFYQLELRQNKEKTEDRFLTKKDIEIIFLRAVSGDINEESYKYLNIDYTEVRDKTQRFLTEFINRKYFAITGSRNPPKLFPRDVILIDSNMRSTSNSVDSKFEQHIHSTGPFSTFAQSEKPVFLLGDLGSGKSTMAAEYLSNIISSEPDIVPIFIPTTYLSTSNFSTLTDFKSSINKFVNNDLQVNDQVFDINNLLRARKETFIIIDGLDELELRQSKLLINNLKSLKAENEKVKVIATGRPIELEGVIPAGWKILSTDILNEKEKFLILYNESLMRGMSSEKAKSEATKKLSFLKGKPQLFTIASTPLIICSIYEQLDQNLKNKTLGDILYSTLQDKLSWNDKDLKADEFTEFNSLYPSKFSKEPLLGELAWRVLNSEDRTVSEVELNRIIANSISTENNKAKVVEEATKYFKNIFLQETTNKKYSFLSNPILECAAGIYISDLMKTEKAHIDFNKDWRSLSFALTVTRQRNESLLIYKNISQIISENLIWSKQHVSQTAIVLAEYQNKDLCKEYFSLLSALPFRPLRVENSNDLTSVNSYAICIDLGEEVGYDWFWDNYLNPIHPLKHYEANLVADIFSQYLLIKDFKLNIKNVIQLSELIKPNIAYDTSFCHSILPVLAILTNNDLSKKQYYRLLASNVLYNGVLKYKSKEILLSESLHFKDEVLNALEEMCAQREEKSIDAAILWIEINTEKPISKTVIRTILASITEENFIEYKQLIVEQIDEEKLKSYLKYCCLANNDLAKQASLYLFLDGEKDFLLIGKNLINSIEWLDSKKISLTNKIYDFVKSQSNSGIDSIPHNIPTDNHLGIPPSFWTIFLPALQLSENDYSGAFAKSIKHLSLLILTRHPELRIAFVNLFNEKIIYKDLVRELMYNLDNKIRYLSASLLLTINSDSEHDALEIVLSGFSSTSDLDEWQTFVLGLRYSKATLDQIYKKINILTEASQIFALTLLSRNNYPLTKKDLELLVDGLLGSGYFNDKSGYGFNAKFHVTLSQKTYKDNLVQYLIGDNLKKAKRAASILKQFHWDDLDNNIKTKVNILHAEHDENYFFEITVKNKNILFEDEYFKLLENNSILFEKQHKKKSLLWLFCKAIKYNTGFPELFKFLIQAEGSRPGSELDHHYEWLKNISKHYPDIKVQITDGIIEMLQIPAVQENPSDLFAWLKLMENEFCIGSNIHQEALQERFRRSEKEVFVALNARNLYNIDTSDLNEKDLFPLFYKNNTTKFEVVDTSEIERLLFDLESIPSKLDSKIEDVIIFGHFTDMELDEFQKKGSLSAYFATVIKFVRNLPVNASLFVKSQNIGSGDIYNFEATEFHKKILFKIYRILISDDEYIKIFINSLSGEMKNSSKNYVDNFMQLLVLEYHFEKEDVIKLFVELDDKPYLLSLDRTKHLSSYLAEKVSLEEGKNYIETIKQILLKCKNHYEKYGSTGNRNALSWILSIALLKFEGKVSEESKASFLLGLQGCFLEKNALRRSKYGEKDYFFTGGELLESTYELLQKVKPELIKEIVEYGSNTNIPEIRAVSYLLLSLAARA